MGNFLSTPESNEIEDLKTRLSNVERLDRDKDGIVSKDEINLWLTEQKKDIEDFKKKVEEASEIKYQKLLSDNEKELTNIRFEHEKLQDENRALKTINDSLEKKLKDRDDMNEMTKNLSASVTKDVRATKQIESALSRKRIDNLIEQFMADPDINIKYFPDGIERMIYRNVFKIMINLFDNIVDTTSIDFMGHKLVFDLQPLSDEEVKKVKGDDKKKKKT